MIHNKNYINKIMKILFTSLKLLVIFVFLILTEVNAQPNYLDEGIELYNNDKIEESKILFERDLVFNPKSEKAYLYLAKIFNKNKNDEEEEINLNNVLILNPQNDQAIYMLTLLKIKQSDYNKAKDLIEQFVLVCKSFCSKKDEIQKKFAKLTPEDEKK